MINPPFLVGERIILRALCDADADGPYLEWFNDAEVCRGNSHHVFPYTQELARRFIQRARESREDLTLAIVMKDMTRHVGNIALQQIHPVYHSAEFAIVLGDRSVWGQGIATEAAVLLLAHGFEALNLHRVACGTFEDNLAMKALALRLGMKEEGRRREAAFKDGKYLDLIEYGVLAEEWHKRQRAHC